MSLSFGPTTNGCCFYFRVLISESSVSDGSHLGKAGVTPKFVVLSDTVFKNDSQQGGMQRRLKCLGKSRRMSGCLFWPFPRLK